MVMRVTKLGARKQGPACFQAVVVVVALDRGSSGGGVVPWLTDIDIYFRWPYCDGGADIIDTGRSLSEWMRISVLALGRWRFLVDLCLGQ